MKSILCCADKQIALRALKYLKLKNIEIVCCLLNRKKDGPSYVTCYCIDHNIPVYTSENSQELEAIYDDNEIDLLISFTYPVKLESGIIKKAKKAINFHPAPLPEYRGCGTPCYGIYHGKKEWGVTCHNLDSGLDTGDVIAVRKFMVEADRHYTGMALSIDAWEKCYELFCEIVDQCVQGRRLKAESQSGGNYYSKRHLEELKKVDQNESAESISRKIRAFWYPPFEGAYVVMDGKKYYLIDDEILRSYDELYQKCEKAGLNGKKNE